MIARVTSAPKPIKVPSVRLLQAVIVVTVAVVAYGLAGILANAAGYPSATLVGRALLGAAGKMGAGEVIAAYPPVALAPMIGVQYILGIPGLTTAQIFAAALAALLAGTWFRAFILAEYRILSALLLTALLAFNPITLRAIANGPEAVLTLCATWSLAISLFSLRGNGSVNDLMRGSAALIILTFCSPVGAALAAASLPFLLLAVPGDIRPRNYPQMYVLLLFPLAFGIAGFVFINWMMLHDPFAFAREVEVLRPWLSDDWLATAAEIVFAVACAPIVLALFVLSRSRPAIQAPAFALLGTMMLAAVIATRTGASDTFAAAVAPVVSIAAAAALNWPQRATRLRHAALLLALGCAGGSSVLLAETRVWPRELHAANLGDNGRSPLTASEAELGRFLAGRSNVLIDAGAHPQIVAARGSAQGLISGTDPDFTLSLLRRRIDTESIAVKAPDTSRNADDVSRIFPDLYHNGVPGYRLAYDRDGWRVWEKMPQNSERP